MKRLIATAAALMFAVTSSPVWGQTPAEHEAHHPSANSATAPVQPAPPAAQAQPSPPPLGQAPGRMPEGMMMNCPMMSGGQAGQAAAMSCPMMSGPAPGGPMSGMGPGMMQRQTQGTAPGIEE